MIFEIKNFKSLNSFDFISDLWNHEYGSIFPLTKELVKKNLDNANYEASFYATVDGKIVGYLIGKTWEDEYIIKPYVNFGWISLIFVSPAYRNNGIGSALLINAEEVFKLLGKTTINLGRDVNNFFPGLPQDLQAFTKFFKNRGFEFDGYAHDLINLNPQKQEIKNTDYVFRPGTLQDKDALIEFFGREWPGRWQYECIYYFKQGGDGSDYMLGFNKVGEIVAFSKMGLKKTTEFRASYSMNFRARFSNLGGIGPLGVAQSYRKLGLGKDIVVAAKNYAIDNHAEQLIIDWTGLTEFYRKMGFEVWKAFNYSSKQIERN